MAMFESEGFCPCNSFGFALRDNPEAKIHEGDMIQEQKAWMVYAPDRMSPHSKYCSIVDAIMLGNNSALGMQIACHLHVINPNPDDSRRKILIRDTFSIHEFYEIAAYGPERDKYAFFVNGRIDPEHPVTNVGAAYVYNDDRYIVVIDDGGGTGDIIITLQQIKIK